MRRAFWLITPLEPNRRIEETTEFFTLRTRINHRGHRGASLHREVIKSFLKVFSVKAVGHSAFSVVKLSLAFHLKPRFTTEDTEALCYTEKLLRAFFVFSVKAASRSVFSAVN
jgi:hypothetical protein